MILSQTKLRVTVVDPSQLRHMWLKEGKNAKVLNARFSKRERAKEPPS
jgi:hypothetical protein